MPLFLVTVEKTQRCVAHLRILAESQAAAKKQAPAAAKDAVFITGKESAPKAVSVVRNKRLVEGSEDWEKAADEVARGEVTLISCADCGYPVVQGYCCETCGSKVPDRNE